MREKESGIRHNEGKTKWGYLHYPSLKGTVDSLVEGYESGRYPKYNWKKGMTTVEVCESLLRHVHAYLDGEDMDGDTGIRHIDRIGANQHILSYTDLFKPEFDNRECKELDKKLYGTSPITGKTCNKEEFSTLIDNVDLDDPDFYKYLREQITKDTDKEIMKAIIEEAGEVSEEAFSKLKETASKAFIANAESALKDPDIGYMWSNVTRQENENTNELKCTKGIEDVKPKVPFLNNHDPNKYIRVRCFQCGGEMKLKAEYTGIEGEYFYVGYEQCSSCAKDSKNVSEDED